MSAPRSRKLRNQHTPVVITRRERGIAIGGSIFIVLFSALLIWAMRPGSFQPGTGGIIYRQPRVAWLVLFVVATAAFAWWFVHRPESKFDNKRRAIVLMLSGVLALAIAVVIFWDVRWDGIVRTYTPPPTFPTTPITTAPPGASTTTPVGSTTTAPGGTSTTAPVGGTTAPTAAGPTTSTPPTSTPATTVAPTTTSG